MPFLKPAESYSKVELDDLIERLKHGDENVAYELVVFTMAESKGIWHGRARAKICRYFKNHPPDVTLSASLVESIIKRLQQGKFSEQFRDQLRMAIRFAPEKMKSIALALSTSELDYVRRYAFWVLQSVDALKNRASRPMGRSGGSASS